jgi:hypothetical protein
MKKISYVVAFAMLLAFSCQKSELRGDGSPKEQKHLRTLSVGVADEESTRVGFDQDNSFYWHRGDKISVLTSAGFREMTLNEGYHGKAIGVFTGDFAEEIGDYVVYPSGDHLMAGGELTYVLPTTYTYASIEDDANSFNPPMLGIVSQGGSLLKHMAGFFRIEVSNIPAGGDDMKFVFRADKRITGGFVVDLTENPPVITADDSEGNVVTINFANDVGAATGVFYVPAPLGTYDTIKVEIRDGDVLLAEKVWADQTLSRRIPKKGSVEVDYVASTDGAVYHSLQAAVDAAVEDQVITLDHDIVLDAPLVLAANKSVVLDLGGNTVACTATSASASCLASVKSGAELTIRNGSVIFAATTPDTQWGGEGQPPYPGYANNTIVNSGVLTLENVYLENMTQRGGASYVIDNYSGARLIINEGTRVVQSGGDIAIRMFNGSAGEIDVTVNGGTISGYRAVWIQLASNNAAIAPVMKLTVTGGTLTSADQTYNQAVYSYSYGNDMKNVFIDVSGGTFNGDIALTGGQNKTNIETLNISGGAFNGMYGGFYTYGDVAKSKETIRVSGGSFPADQSYYLAPGYQTVLTDGRYVVIPDE